MMTGSKIVEKAKEYLGKGGLPFCKEYGFSYIVAWCCIFVWYVFRKAKAAKLFYAGGKVCNCRVAWNWCRANLRHVSMSDAQAGDIIFFTWTGKGYNKENGALSIDHIGLIRTKGTSAIARTIEGNTGGGSPATNKVMCRDRASKYVLGIYRPKYDQEDTKNEKGLLDVAKYAIKRAKEHHKYKLGGWSWDKGIECHGFTGRCFKDLGYKKVYNIIHKKGFWRKFNNNAYLGKYRVAYNAKGVPASKLLPGDILLSSKTGHHSAIYVGNGKVAEAVRKGTRVAKLGHRFRYAYRVEPKNLDKGTGNTPTKKKPVKSVEHKAAYEVVSSKGMNIRKSYSTSSARVGGIKKGATFKTSKKHGNWVYSKDLGGWVCIKNNGETYLKKV